MIITAANIYVVPCGNRCAVMLELQTDAGIAGIGEAGIAYGAGTIAVAQMTKEMVERFILNQDPNPIGSLWHKVYDNGFWTKGGGAISLAALSAIEHALWDIKGRALGVPVYSLLGGPFSDRLETYANGWWVGCDTPAEYAAAAVRMVADGYRGLKLYPLGKSDPVMVVKHPQRRTIDRAHQNLVIERCAAIRAAVGAQVDILLDFGGGLSIEQLLPLIRRLEPLDICLIEEPVDPGLPHVLGRVAQTCRIPIATGERLYTRSDFHTTIAAGGISIAQPNACTTGGLLEAIKVASLAETHNMRVAPHNYGGPLATVINAHFSAAIPNFMVLEIFPYFDQEPGYFDVLDQPLEKTLQDGYLPLPTGPGFGVSLLANVVQDYRFAALSA